jgi:hypothetical protein
MLIRKPDLQATNDLDALTASCAEALFVSGLSAHVGHTPTEVTAAIRQAVFAHRGVDSCLSEVASAYGEHPETAAPRMRWALAVVQAVYMPTAHILDPPAPGPQPSRCILRAQWPDLQ